MSGLSLNRTKDLGDAKHNWILNFRLAIVDSATRSGQFSQPYKSGSLLCALAPLREISSRPGAKAHSQTIQGQQTSGNQRPFLSSKSRGTKLSNYRRKIVIA